MAWSARSGASSRMLVLTRKVGERILLGDEIAITIVRVTGGGVRIGIEAPDGMPIVREELVDAQRSAKNESVPARESV